MKKNASNKQQDLTLLGLGIVAIILLNVASQYVFHRFDLTNEGRYTLAESTVEMLDSIDDGIYFEVYLEGQFPQGTSDFKRLRDETQIMLEEFRAYNPDNIEYSFVDPSANEDENARMQFQQQLVDKGMYPHAESNIDDNGMQVNQLLFPWAVARYRGREIVIPLMGSSSLPNEKAVNNAIEGLEYELSNGMRKARMDIKPKIAITQGHGEADSLEVADFLKGLREYYEVEFVPFGAMLNTFRDTLQNATQIRNKYDALIMIGPDSAFTTQELFILDQFIIYGGKAMFMVDATTAKMDSIQMQGSTMVLRRHYGITETDPGLEEVLYSYGAGLKTELVEDMKCSKVQIPVGQGQQMQFVERDWYYSPTILPGENHPIVRNLDLIKFDFVGSIDTITTSAPIRKDILLKSSDKSNIFRAPSELLLMMSMYDRQDDEFKRPGQPVAVLLEGPFNSYFKQKILPDEIVNSKEIGYIKTGKPSKIIVIADGDVASNPIRQGEAGPLGIDRFNRLNPSFYANKVFLLNCVNYLLDDQGLISVRSREVTLRLLDRTKAKDQRSWWQAVNVGAPIFSILLFGFFRMWSRKRMYGSQRDATAVNIMDYVLPMFAGLAAYMITQSILAAVFSALSILTVIFWTKRRTNLLMWSLLLGTIANLSVWWWARGVIPVIEPTRGGILAILLLNAIVCAVFFARALVLKRQNQTN
jgi:gliding-associated putative ABC transporter substrate-binding component GldG